MKKKIIIGSIEFFKIFFIFFFYRLNSGESTVSTRVAKEDHFILYSDESKFIRNKIKKKL